ncbi:MAG: universal stress protein [Clostridia bacterium]|nr:universal stress protein [Clostridia bacterium]
MYKKILFPTSGSPISEKIAETIIKLINNKDEAEITILYVMKIPQMYGDVPYQLEGEGVDTSQIALEDAQRVLAKATKVFDDNKVPYTIRIEFGDPVKNIIKVAQETNSELMVVGHHGESKLSDYLFKGNVTSQLINNATCPVLVVK